MSDHSERIRTALMRKTEPAHQSKLVAQEVQGEKAMSSISVSAENLEALLQGAKGKPRVEAAHAPEHAASDRERVEQPRYTPPARLRDRAIETSRVLPRPSRPTLLPPAAKVPGGAHQAGVPHGGVPRGPGANGAIPVAESGTNNRRTL